MTTETKSLPPPTRAGKWECEPASEMGLLVQKAFHLNVYRKCKVTVSVSSDAITKYHRLDGLNRHLLVPILEAGQSEIRVPSWSRSGEDPLPGFAGGCFLAESSHGL